MGFLLALGAMFTSICGYAPLTRPGAQQCWMAKTQGLRKPSALNCLLHGGVDLPKINPTLHLPID
jgi:hypothetical protein